MVSSGYRHPEMDDKITFAGDFVLIQCSEHAVNGPVQIPGYLKRDPFFLDLSCRRFACVAVDVLLVSEYRLLNDFNIPFQFLVNQDC